MVDDDGCYSYRNTFEVVEVEEEMKEREREREGRLAISNNGEDDRWKIRQQMGSDRKKNGQCYFSLCLYETAI